VCLCVCPHSNIKTTLAIKTKVGMHILYGISLQGCEVCCWHEYACQYDCLCLQFTVVDLLCQWKYFVWGHYCHNWDYRVYIVHRNVATSFIRTFCAHKPHNWRYLGYVWAEVEIKCRNINTASRSHIRNVEHNVLNKWTVEKIGLVGRRFQSRGIAATTTRSSS